MTNKLKSLRAFLRDVITWEWVLFTFALTALLPGIAFTSYMTGHRDGVRQENQRQVRTYNDGWQDGQQDLIDRMWNMHYHGDASK